MVQVVAVVLGVRLVFAGQQYVEFHHETVQHLFLIEDLDHGGALHLLLGQLAEHMSKVGQPINRIRWILLGGYSILYTVV